MEEGDKQKDPLADIYEHYEPSELEQKHFTSEDEKIRQLDVPERLQVPPPPQRFIFEGRNSPNNFLNILLIYL